MEFHNYVSHFARVIDGAELNEGKAYARKLARRNVLDVYAQLLAEPVTFFDDDTKNFLTSRQYEAEYAWYAKQQPYYRIYPDYVDMFSRTQLAIPLKHLNLPYSTFTVRFAKGHEPEAEGYKIASFAFAIVSRAERSAYLARIAALKQRTANTWDVPQLERELAQYDDTRSLMLYIQPASGFGMTSRVFVFEPSSDDETLDAWIEEALQTHDPYLPDSKPQMTSPYGEITFLCLRVGIAISFLATGTDRVVEPDVLNKDFRAYLDAVNRKDAAAVKTLHQHASRTRGQVGFTVGRADALLGRRSHDVDTTATHDANGQPMQYQHWRNAHMQLYWTGPGRTVPEIKFKRAVVVRPDLPIDPRQRGYRTLHSRQEMASSVPTPVPTTSPTPASIIPTEKEE